MALKIKNIIKCSQLSSWINTIQTRETLRQRNTINLIPSENIAFPQVIQSVGSNFCNKYSEGYPYRRYYGGNEVMDEVETTGINLAKKVFSVPFANL